MQLQPGKKRLKSDPTNTFFYVLNGNRIRLCEFMPRNLTTDWTCIGRSGPTIDGRLIKPEMIDQAADSYDVNLYTAVIKQDHYQGGYSLGMVRELKSAANSEGGRDLFAKLAPNDYFLSLNKDGQALFTSMELLPNFRGTGKFYLTGLAATDNPASAATTELRFASISDTATLLSAFTQHPSLTTPDDEHPPRWFTKFFTKSTHSESEDDMDAKTIEAFNAKFAQMEQSIAVLKPAETPDADAQKEDYATLKAEFEAFKVEFAKQPEKADDTTAEQLKKLTEDFSVLADEFKKAISETNGTDGGEHFSAKTDTDDLKTDC